jgi:drug/metabolite transporter (DMT)-like permease
LSALPGRPAAAVSATPAALALVFNAFTWGVSWWPFRQLEGVGLHPLWATVLIYAFAVLVITLARPAAWRELFSHPALWLLVVASGTTNAAFNWAVTIGDVVRIVLLFYLMPLWAVLLARLLLHEPLTRGAMLRVVLALAGALVILWPPGGGLPLPHTLAEALGVIGGFSFALNNVMLRREAARSEGVRALAMFVGGAVVAGLLATLLGPAGTVPPGGTGRLFGGRPDPAGQADGIQTVALPFGDLLLDPTAVGVFGLSGLDGSGCVLLHYQVPPLAPMDIPFAFQAANSAKLAGYDWSAVFGTNNPVAGTIPFSKLAQRQASSAERALLEQVEASLAGLREVSITDAQLIRGVLDTQGIAKRRQRRSKYGAKRPK